MSDEHKQTDALADPGHLFDQTNGVAEGLEGDSDGTADSDLASRSDRDGDDPGFSTIDAGTAQVTDGGPRTGIGQ